MGNLILDVFFGIPVEELLPLARKVGFDGIFIGQEAANFCDKVEELSVMARRENLKIETIHSTIPGCVHLWEAGKAGEDYVSVLKNNIDNCARFDIPILVVHIQTKEETVPMIEAGLGRLEVVVDYAEKKGIKVAFENINHPQLLFAVMEHFAQPHVGFCYDSGHEACHTPGMEYLPVLGERLFCVHLHDNDGAGDLHQLPFEGKLDFDRICRQLREKNYRGNITLELSYTKEYQAKMGKEEFIRQAYDSACRLRKMITE